MDFFDKIVTIHENTNIGLSGMTDEFFCVYVSKLLKKSNRNIIILTSTLYEANKIFSSLKNYTQSVLLFPMDDFLTGESIAISPELKTTRLDTLNKLTESDKNIVVCHLESYLRYLPSVKKFNSSKINLFVGNTYSRQNLIDNLVKIGYLKDAIVTNVGEFGIRGFVIDVYPINSDYPIRIEFFDDQIESIREFDPQSQKSLRKIEKITIMPNSEFLFDKEMSPDKISQKYLPFCLKDYTNIESYLFNPIRIIKDISQIKASYKKLISDIFEYRNLKDKNYDGNYIYDINDFNFSNSIYYNTIDNLFDNIVLTKKYDFNVKKVPLLHENIADINDYIHTQLNNKKTVIISLRDYQSKSFLKYLNYKYVLTDNITIYENKVNIIKQDMNEGFIYGNYVFLTSKELFNKTPSIKYKNKFKYSSKINSLSNLEIGDYVVHASNGIGIYNGIKTLTKNGLKKDYLEVQYAGLDKLYIPVEKIQLIGKYTGKEGIVPKINKLGSSDWEKTKLRVRNKVHDIAKRLLELYAKRQMNKGFAFLKDDELQAMFESEFEFNETPDQIRAIAQIKSDMELPSPMDRLLCGDVGYGKTEVAFRAMFKAVNNSKQVLYLCPTTILSAQQYTNAKERFSNYPVNIEVLNRYTSSKKAKQIVEDLKNGKIDILFGTHRLLSSDIKPKDLGLLVIDEEQRFGVVHKEKIKEYKENIDVLTLTATPIPRTLQMSLVGMRSLSLIETPPVDRYPVQTYVIEENKALIKDAIYKEMARNGQVFILYNNVKNIENKVIEIQELIPEARIVYAHGQLNKSEIENKMTDFINYKYDIMICTTIIETGIDINNVNTLIIYNADSFGLSQLYQLRGRVGRSNKIAYAYLMYKKDKILSETAVKRLQVIKEFTELGSGFAIASRDLSIRGAGDILGSEQAGFIDSIGIDLYLKILNEEVERLKGNTPKEEKQENNNNILEVETHISDDYVEDEELKIEIHKLINSVNSLEKLNIIKEELEDRFGKVDEKMLIYMHEEWFEALVDKYNISRVRQTNKFIELSFDKEMSNKIDGESLFVNAIKLTKNFTFSYENQILKVVLNLRDLDRHYIYYLTELLNKIMIKDND